MKTIDVCFSASDMCEIHDLVGKKLVKYKCDPFEKASSVYGIVGISFGDAEYAFTNLTEVMDYYGRQEDVAILKIQRRPLQNVHSLIQGQDTIEMLVDNTVSGITVVNEHQMLFRNEEHIYDVLLTRGIIFRFQDGYELSLEKNIWFSEDITVKTGYDLISQFTPVTEFGEGWSGEYCGTCRREMIIF